MASIDLRFRLDQTKPVVPGAEADLGLAYIGHTGSTMTIVSGMAVANALGYAGFGNDQFVNDAIKASGGGLVPQTMGTAVYQNIYLVAGTRLEIGTTFDPSDRVHNDEAFTLLKNLATGEITPVHVANVNDVIKNQSQNYTVTYKIGTTGYYNLLVGVADIGDKARPASLTVNSLTTVVPGGQYKVIPQGVQLADNSVLRSDNSILIGSAVLPSALANSAGSTVAALQSLLKQNLISQDGGGLISQDGGGIVSHDAGGIVSHDAGGIVSHDAGGAIAIDPASLISQDGGGVTAGILNGAQLAQIAANLASANGAAIRAFGAASTAGLTSGHNYGLMSLDAPTDPVPDTSAVSTRYVAPVPGLEVDLTGAAALRYDSRSAVADLGAGRYVVAFTEYVIQPNGARAYAIRAQVVNADGSLSGPELTVNNPNDTDSRNSSELADPSVAATGGGGFVVAWVNGQHSRPPGLTTGSDLFAQRFNADGSPNGAGIVLDAVVSDTQYFNVKVAGLSGGGYVAVWSEKPGNGSNDPFTLHGKVFEADGTQRGADLSLSGSKYFANLFNPAVAATSNGGFVVAFEGTAPNPVTGGTLTGIGIQAYDATGAATGKTTLVQASATDVLTKPNVAVLVNGDIAVAWVDTTDHNVYSLVMTSALVAKGEATIIGGSYSDFYGPPAITATSDGRFLVGWTEGSSGKAQAQAVSDDNTLYGPQFDVAAPGGGDSTNAPALVQLSTGTLVASSTHQFDSLGGSGIRTLPINLGASSTVAATRVGQPLNTGSAVDGYIAGATVFADANGNGTLDAGEVSTKTTADGAFALAPGARGPLVLTGGTDITTGQAFTGRFTAPEGSHAINALTTLVQGVIARGSDVGTAGFQVATAFGMAADAELTNLDAMTAAASSSETGRALLLANALVSDIATLAAAAGSSDALGAFASLIASKAGFTAFDPSSSASLAAAGLSGQVLADAGAIAAAIKALLASQAATDGNDTAKLVRDVGKLEVVVHAGAAAFASAIGTGTTAQVAAAYTGDALQAKFGAAVVQLPVTSTSSGAVGVFRFFDSKFGTHFFTASADERNSILATRPDLVNEGVGLTAIDPAAQDPNASAVYRFFDTTYGTHFFTASADERDQVIATRKDLAFEGTGFYEHTTQQSGDTPVYRFFDKNFGTHFYTGDGGERASILATRTDLVDEGIGFYAPKAAS